MKRWSKAAALVGALVFLPGFGSIERFFAPNADLWERWRAHDPASSQTIDHASWDALLSRYVRPASGGANLIDYRGFSLPDRASLAGYLDALARLPISRFNRDEQLAYWINLYNALTMQVVLDHFPVASIRDIGISPGLFRIGPWDKRLIAIEGQALTLNDIEHRILRPIWRDPRIHYAVNCASVGCPDLRPSAYRGASIERALNEAASDYINDPRGVSISDGQVTVSKIYDWFIADFGGTEASVIRHLEQYAAPELRARLAAIGKLSGTRYDWSLNAAAE